MTNIACIVLAAGEGTRMKSKQPKVLHEIAGRSLLGHVLSAANCLGANQFCVIRGPKMGNVETEAQKYAPNAQIAEQADRKGTGHAVKMAEGALSDFSGTIIILYGDVPLIRPSTLMALSDLVTSETPLAVLGFKAADAKGYGRLIQTDAGNLIAIREELDASDEERKINLCNSGIMAVSSNMLWKLLAQVQNDNAKGEYYLTDIVGLCVDAGKKVGISECDENQVAGVNDRMQLANMEAVLQKQLRIQAMKNGATLIAPDTVFFSADTKLGSDVVVEPHVFFAPGVEVGDGVTIGGFCHLAQTSIGENALVGPFARLRPGTVLGPETKVGNFVEIKKSTVAGGAKVNHLSYIGDTQIGEKANIGAGTITCNYDGFDKHTTKIGAGAFIGSNSSLIAPVNIGQGAYVGSGSVISRPVPQDALALTRAEQKTKEKWAERFRAIKAKKSNKG